MIPNPANVCESVQNEVAARIMTASIFQNLKMPDGSPWQVRTEDEAVVEEIFRQYIAECGLCVIVHSPQGDFKPEYQFASGGPMLDPMKFEVSISEAVMFNRNGGTGIRIMLALQTVLQMLNNWSPASVRKPIFLQGIERGPSSGIPLKNPALYDLPDGTAIVAIRRVKCEIPAVSIGLASISP